jgi:arginyl-tRNA synthetase
LLVRFPAIAERSAREYAPHHVTQYLIELAGAFNSWYAQEHILDGTPAAAHKVALAQAVGVTLKRGLWLLGIPAPEKM